MILSALMAVALLSHPAQGLTQKITFETKAVPVHRLLKHLAAKTGVELGADAETGKQVAIVSVKDIEFKTLMDKLAATLNAEWRQDKTAYVLTHTPTLRQKEQQASLRLRREQLQKSLDPIFKRLKPEFNQQEADLLLARLLELKRRRKENPQDPEPHRLYEQEQQSGAVTRAVIRLLQTIPLDELASIPVGERVLYTNRPTKMQRPFGAGSKEVLADLTRDHEMWMETLKRAEVARDEDNMSSDPLAQTAPMPSAQSKIYLVAQGTDLEWRLFNLESGDGHGRRILTQLMVSGAGRSLYEEVRNRPDDKKDLIPMSPESELYVSLIKQARNRALPARAFAKGSPAEQFLDPVANEPLGLLPSDGLLAEARAQNKNLIAWLPDETLMLTISQAIERPLSRAAFLTLLQHPDFGIELQSADGWLAGRPRDPARARARQTNREALRDILMASQEKGRITLVDYAKFAASCNHGPYSGFGSIMFFMVDPMFSALSDASRWNVLQFYGSLTDNQRLTLDRGGTIPFNTFNPLQRRFATTLTYADEINNYKTENSNTMEIVYPQQEPTEALPTGLPAEGFVALQLMKKPTILVFSRTSEGNVQPYRTVDEYNLAHMMHRENKGGQTGPYQEPKAAGYQIGENSIMKLRLVYGEKLWNEFSMAESAPVGPLNAVQYAGLPADLRRRVDAQLKQIVDNEAVRTSGGSKPPPPR